MKSNQLNINSWQDSILNLSPKPPQNLLKLHKAGVTTLEDLIWIFPLRSQIIPPLQDFSQISEDNLFLGQGKIIHQKIYPAFGRRGKNRITLFNANLVLKDESSEKTAEIKFFNIYPNHRKKISELKTAYFLGKPTLSKGKVIFANPQINEECIFETDTSIIEYPTVAGVAGKFIQKFISQIPEKLWEQELSKYPQSLHKTLELPSLNNCLKIIHTKAGDDKFDSIQRVKYEEFLQNHLKIRARKISNQHLRAEKYHCDQKLKSKLLNMFPYELTPDQVTVFENVLKDLESGRPMMRLIQGDVGSGKTTIAILVAYILSLKSKQTAFMCPTETLARQHYETFKEVLGDQINIQILVGSNTQKEKTLLYKDLANGKIDLIIGTHALIQEKVIFKDLALSIIDEQHKFGVDQRLKLTQKGHNIHTLIMTATPIPRSLQLVQYGDLDISTIKTMPLGRKEIKTRIVQTNNYEKYLSFLKTRLSLGEQVYIVVPAIEESEFFDIENVQSLSDFYQKNFPEYKISLLHGNLKASEKNEKMLEFKQQKSQILISTTVIEVGINIPTATVMSIYNPERFGLSSLHQLRGRVGRGEFPGFCFLVSTKSLSQESLSRLKVIENSLDGFVIAEADLKNRGMGDLFGNIQTGHISSFKIANIVEDLTVFQKMVHDYEKLEKIEPEIMNKIILNTTFDIKVSTTI